MTWNRALTPQKRDCLAQLSTPAGIIGALALDQRKSLRQLLARAAQVTPEQVADAQLVEFKSCVAAALTPYASAVLLDPDFGLDAAPLRDTHCGLMFAYELDGYENPRPHRMLALGSNLSVRRLCEMGAQGIKILLHYAPHDSESANDEKCAIVERIGCECVAMDVPFFLEPVIYDPAGLDPRSLEFARLKPQFVIDTIELFSRDIYRVDVLKVEFPVASCYVDGTAVHSGEAACSLDQALDAHQRVDAAARCPYIYLSAGVSTAEFLESLRLAIRAGSRFSGVLCGRATWQDGVAAYAKPGPRFDRAALEHWLETSGVANIRAINHVLASACPWQRWFE